MWNCPICHGEFNEDKNMVITECKHKFCLTCFVSNYNNSENGHTCPLCRNELVEEKVNNNLDIPRIRMEASNILYKMFDSENIETFPVFKELLEYINNCQRNIKQQLRESYGKEIIGRWVMAEFIQTFINNINNY